ncbi:MAG: DUF3788 domain-containing protein [Anaerolineaceae bacterium]|jgi:hypothetical protein
MSVSFFADKTYQPADAEIREAIGPLFSTWQELAQWIREKYPTQEDFKFLYGKNYGWGLRFRIKSKPLITLYPGQGNFTAQVILRPEAIEKVQSTKLGQNAQQAIERATPYPEGRWLFIPVESKSDLEDVQRLLALRVEKQSF